MEGLKLEIEGPSATLVTTLSGVVNRLMQLIKITKLINDDFYQVFGFFFANLYSI